MKIYVITLLCCISFFLHATLSQQPIQNTSKIWYGISPEQWPGQLRPSYLSYNNTFLLDLLYPFLGTQKWLTFLDTRFLWNDKISEQNYGLGIRSLLGKNKWIGGSNIFWDHQKSPYKNHFHQLGFGLEALSRWVDMRINGYFPLSGSKYIDQDFFYYFEHRSLMQQSLDRGEKPLKGFDYEGGVLIPKISKYIETKVYVGGAHYFWKNHPTKNGLKTRLELRPFPFLTCNIGWFQYTDKASHSFIETYLSLPFSFSRKKTKRAFHSLFHAKNAIPPRFLSHRMTDRVERDLYIVSSTFSKTENKSILEDITFVDNSKTGAEDGSLEYPFHTIQGGIDHAIGDQYVYVFQGNDVYPENVSLTSGTTLWGEGYNRGYYGISSDKYPTVEGNFSRRIEMADNSSIFGMKLQNGNGGIVGIGVSNVVVDHNIVLDNLSAEFYGGIAFLLTNSGTMENITISDNACSNKSDIQIRTMLVAHGTISQVIINNNEVQNCGESIHLQTQNDACSISNVWITNNHCTAGIATGILLESTGEIKHCQVENNIVDNTLAGMVLQTEGSGTISDVSFSNNYSHHNDKGFAFSNNGTMSAIIYNNILESNRIGARFYNASSGGMDIDLGSSDVRGNNSFYANSEWNISSEASDLIQALYNWWGTFPPNTALLSGNIHYLPALKYKPSR
ncbi:MAG: inverse autotransporter beta domain-containing protein [Parachlamydiales bacterium]|nr:inverse autotransporter beta domain-containing protein [Parachlamydiales bacterium]